MSTPDQDFVERMGLLVEADGLPRIGGRLFGLLILSDQPRSLDELADSLGVSKASISTDARRLLERGVVERVTRPGDRRDYYRLAPDFYRRTLEHRLAKWARFGQAVAECRARLGATNPAVADRLDGVLELQQRVSQAVSDALEGESAPPPVGAANAPRRSRR